MGVGALNLDLFYEVEDLGELGLEAGREVCCGPHGFEELYRRAKAVSYTHLTLPTKA